MLVQLGVNEDLVKCHSLAHRIPGSVVAWNGRKYEEVLQSKTQANLWATVIAAGGSLYGFNAWVPWKSGDLGMSNLCGAIFFGSAAMAASSSGLRDNASDCADFLNGLLCIANGFRKDKAFQQVVRPRPLVKLLARMLIAVQVVYPWSFSLVALSLPCSPLNMFSSVIHGWSGEGGNNPGSNMTWLMRMVIGVGTSAPHFVFWSALMSQGILDAMHIFLGSLCHEILQKFMSTRPCSDFPSQLKLYRSCQFLNICYSKYCSSGCLALISTVMAVEISFTYLGLKILGGSSNLPVLLKAVVIATVPVVYLFHMMAVGKAGDVNANAISILAKLLRQNNLQPKLTRRQIRSCWPLKIKLGDSNFVEASTALVLLDFTPRRLVDLLLIE